MNCPEIVSISVTALYCNESVCGPQSTVLYHTYSTYNCHSMIMTDRR